MEELIKAMSNDDLTELKVKYANNESVVTLVDGILEARGKEAEQVEAKAKFESGIFKLFAKLPHPEGIYNVLARWAGVDVPNGEPEEVIVDGEPTTRQPTRKEYQWVITINAGQKVSSGSGGDATPKATKRAITVFKREGTTLAPKGNFPSASKACEVLGLTIGSDSAIRVLARDGYITEAYEGTDFS